MEFNRRSFHGILAIALTFAGITGFADCTDQKAAVLSGADASAANFTRVASDVSALPAERRFVANVLEARIKERLQNEADAKGAALTVAYRLDPSLGGETAKE